MLLPLKTVPFCCSSMDFLLEVINVESTVQTLVVLTVFGFCDSAICGLEQMGKMVNGI